MPAEEPETEPTPEPLGHPGSRLGAEVSDGVQGHRTARTHPLSVPEPVVHKAARAGAQWWLDALPELVADLERDWRITVGRALGGGTEAFVAEATTAEGERAVLKLVLPQGLDAARHEITTLRLADGQGCARLLRDDATRGALLVERLGSSLADAGSSFWRRQEILADLAAQVWRPAADSGLPTGAEKARYLVDFVERLWSEFEGACSRPAVDYALGCARRRADAHSTARAVLVHADIHAWNALRRPDGGYALVDPDGLLAEPEADLGILLREDPDHLLSGDPWAWTTWLARRTGTDPIAIWEWGAIERVSTGLLLCSIGMTDIGTAMLRAAEVAAAAPPVSG